MKMSIHRHFHKCLSWYPWRNEKQKNLFAVIENELKRIAVFSQADTDNTSNIKVIYVNIRRYTLFNCQINWKKKFGKTI